MNLMCNLCRLGYFDGCFFSMSVISYVWDIRSLTLIKTYVLERPINAVVLRGGQDASAITTTNHRVGKFEAKFYDKIGGVKGHFGPINALAFNPGGKSHPKAATTDGQWSSWGFISTLNSNSIVVITYFFCLSALSAIRCRIEALIKYVMI
ncbi:hypothetical protein L1887_03769 [Cichorium endivia]|nr:hypothetical protein L1887_03769 [Cichorium endivia]